MIPVEGHGGGRTPDLPFLVASELDRIERGLVVIASAVPFPDAALIELLAQDADRRIVLILIEDGPAEPLFERAARALYSYRRTAPLLARLYPNCDIDSRETPRLVLIARRFSDTTLGMLRSLSAREPLCLECSVVDGAAGQELVITSHGEERTPVRMAPPAQAANLQGNGTRGVSGGNGHADPRQEDRQPAPSRRQAADPLFDEVKQRLLRLSPDVTVEQNGDLACFSINGHLLATVSRQGRGVKVAAGDEGSDEIRVGSHDDLGLVMEIVFTRFFEMTSIRKRVAAAGARAAERISGRRQYPVGSGPRQVVAAEEGMI